MLQIKEIRKQYVTGELVQTALDGVSLNLRDNEFVAILGPSGSGKTTLLNVIGGLDKYASGALTIDGKSIRDNTDVVRNNYIGYIFQNYNLSRGESCYENVATALRLCGMKDQDEITDRVDAALTNVGMEKFANRTPDTLSGGQQQRIARSSRAARYPRGKPRRLLLRYGDRAP